VTECTKDDKVDLGYDVSIECRYLDGQFEGMGWWHPCTGGAQREDFIGVKPASGRGWDVVHKEPLTLFPSIRCLVCGFHGYITKGRWCPA
jgi:hypothetical protein